ncbi:hypothetical protein Trydic_g3603 [Trypoxylus dichotomus]
MPMKPGRPPTQAAAGTAEVKRTTSNRTMSKTTPTTTTADQQATTGTLKRAERRTARKSGTTEVALNEAIRRRPKSNVRMTIRQSETPPMMPS